MPVFQLVRQRSSVIRCLTLLPFLAPTVAAAQRDPPACAVLDGGGGIKVHGYEAVFDASSDANGSTLFGLVLVRAPAGFLTRSVSAAKAHQALMNGPHGAGGSIGPLLVVHDRSTNTVWIDSLAVPLKAGNNLLLVEIDPRDAVHIVGQARIDPHISVPSGPCDDGAALRRYHLVADSLWARFQASPQVRAFLNR